MAEQDPNLEPDEELHLELVTTPKPKRGEEQRNAAGMAVYSTGRCPSNVGGAELVYSLARRLGMDPDSLYTQFRVDGEKGIVAIQLVRAQAPGAVPLRQQKKKRTVTIYLGGVFQDYPNLRVSSPKDVTLHLSPDGKRIIFNLKSTLDRASGGGNESTNTESTKKPTNTEKQKPDKK